MTNRYQVTWELYKSWAIEKVFTTKNIIIAITQAVLLPIILYLFFSNLNSFLGFLCILFAIFTIYSFYNGLFIHPLKGERDQYDKTIRMYGEEGWIRETIFQDDDIVLTEGKFTLSFSYKNIDKIEEKGNQVKIFFYDKTFLRLYKDAFVDSDWGACKEKLYQERYGGR